LNKARPSKEPVPPFRLFRPDKPALALGLAVSHLMTKPAFAKLPFGEWSRILVGQVNRGHYYFVVDANNQIQGFAGWALTTRDKAEAWAAGSNALTYEDSLEGECFVCNAWSANSNDVHRWMMRQAREYWKDRAFVYFKRFYPDGRVRPSRMKTSGRF
jgi:hemolysin-activating ACP:hemolysin acyltransferase